MLNLLKIRLPINHFRPFSALTVDDINNNLECKLFDLKFSSYLII